MQEQLLKLPGVKAHMSLCGQALKHILYISNTTVGLERESELKLPPCTIDWESG